MHYLRCVYAEWLLLRPRLIRTRYGFSLLLLGGVLVWLRTRGLDPLTVSLNAGALGAVIGVAFVVGSEHDRAALPLALTHPTTALAIASGRWLAAVLPAVALTVATGVIAGSPASSAGAGLLAAGAVGGLGLTVALAFGSVGVGALFLLMALAGAVPPERLVAVAQPGVLQIVAASALELGPALWHYREAISGGAGAILHAGAWSGLGVLLASALIARRRFR